MKTTIKALIFSASLFASTYAGAAQESYGLPSGSTPRPGSSIWHNYQCSIPRIDGGIVYGVRYVLQVATAALPPQYNVTGISLKSSALAPRAVLKPIPLQALGQDMKTALFGNDYVTVTVEKSNFDARIQFSNGTLLNCVVVP